MRSNPENPTTESGLDFRGSSKNNANQRFAVFRDQLSPEIAEINDFGNFVNARKNMK
jgi:hypothetical protein